MKFFIAILCLFVSNVFLQLCLDQPILKCAEKSLYDGKCAIFEAGSKPVIHLANCPNDETCNGIINGKLYNYCQKRLPRYDRWEQEKCNYKEECLSNICTSKKCESIADGGDCSQNKYACSNKSFCNDKKKCQALIKEGQECSKDNDVCDFPFICGKKESKASYTCIKMFSVSTGSYTKNALNCISGFMVRKDDGDNYCAESTQTAEKCTQNKDCKQTITFASGDTKTIDGKCVCSAAGIQGYCSITTDKEEWKDMLKVYKDLTKETFENTDNIVELSQLTYGKDKWSYWGNDKLYQALAATEHYAVFKEADECAIRFWTNSEMMKYSLGLMLTFLFALV